MELALREDLCKQKKIFFFLFFFILCCIPARRLAGGPKPYNSLEGQLCNENHILARRLRARYGNHFLLTLLNEEDFCMFNLEKHDGGLSLSLKSVGYKKHNINTKYHNSDNIKIDYNKNDYGNDDYNNDDYNNSSIVIGNSNNNNNNNDNNVDKANYIETFLVKKMISLLQKNNGKVLLF
jgi:hypothetical protein